MLSEKLFKALKDKKKDLSDDEKEAKMDVIKDLRSSAMDSMKEKLDGLKKVSVASDSQEGLEKGLDKAKQLISGEEMGEEAEMEQMKPHAFGGEETPEEESMEEIEGLDYDALMEKIQKLQEMASKMKK